MALRLADTEAPQGPLEDEAARIIEAPHEAFALDARGQIRLGETAVATMIRGADLLRPDVQVTLEEPFGAGAVAQVRRRMLAWTRDLVAELLAPLRSEPAARLSPAGKGLVYQLEHGLGSCLRARAEMQVRSLSADDRKIFGQIGVSLGALVVFVPALLEASAVTKRAALWSAAYGKPPALPPAGRVSVPVEAGVDVSWYHALGYPPFGPRAVRADQAERSFSRLLQVTSGGPTALPQELASWLGCSQAEAGAVAEAMGLTRVDDERYVFVRPERGRHPHQSRSRRRGGS